MQIKKFRANDTAEALRLIRKEFGSQAVILSTKDVDLGAGVFGFRKKCCVEVTAATDAEPQKTVSELGDIPVKGLSLKTGAKGSVSSILPARKQKAVSSYREKSMNVVGRFKPAKLRGGFSRKTDQRMQFFGFYKELQDQGVKENIAMDLVKELGRFSSSKRGFGAEDLKQGVIEILKKMGAVTKPIKIIRGEQKIVAMVGPAGVGKTTTIAKLAALGRLKSGRRLGMISLDDKKIGAVAELGVYSRILNVPMEAASTRGQLEQSLHNLRRKDVILIDTPGISRKENALMRRMQDLLQSVRSAEIHLLMSATTREKDFKAVLDRFKLLNINSLIFTRMDDSTEYGDLLNQLVDTRIPASYFADGPQVPENIEVATLDRLVELILKKNHAEKIAAPVARSRQDNRKRLVYGPYPEKSYAYS
ncbi:MAG: flagellar biosynthesis protein FlhF [Deltaproteobacteria bacterium]|nr:flagellar biosynthesis protein FlhF [Deltaproteobacteria bacterium]